MHFKFKLFVLHPLFRWQTLTRRSSLFPATSLVSISCLRIFVRRLIFRNSGTVHVRGAQAHQADAGAGPVDLRRGPEGRQAIRDLPAGNVCFDVLCDALRRQLIFNSAGTRWRPSTRTTRTRTCFSTCCTRRRIRLGLLRSDCLLPRRRSSALLLFAIVRIPKPCSLKTQKPFSRRPHLSLPRAMADLSALGYDQDEDELGVWPIWFLISALATACVDVEEES